MTDTEKKEIEANILAQIEKLNKKIAELKGFTDPVSPDDAIGRVSRMDTINNKTIFDASMRNSQERLSQLTVILKHNAMPISAFAINVIRAFPSNA